MQTSLHPIDFLVQRGKNTRTNTPKFHIIKKKSRFQTFCLSRMSSKLARCVRRNFTRPDTLDLTARTSFWKHEDANTKLAFYYVMFFYIVFETSWSVKKYPCFSAHTDLINIVPDNNQQNDFVAVSNQLTSNLSTRMATEARFFIFLFGFISSIFSSFSESRLIMFIKRIHGGPGWISVVV